MGHVDSHRHRIIPLYMFAKVFGEPLFPDLDAAILILSSCRQEPRLRFIINALAGMAQLAVGITVCASSFALLLRGILFVFPMLKAGHASVFLSIYCRKKPTTGHMPRISISATLIILLWSPG
jgi:hypothetical protein